MKGDRICSNTKEGFPMGRDYSRQRKWAPQHLGYTRTGDKQCLKDMTLTMPSTVHFWECLPLPKFIHLVTDSVKYKLRISSWLNLRQYRALKQGASVVDTVGWTTTYNVCILHEHWFESWLYHLWSSSLIMSLRKQRKIAQVPELLPSTSETWMKFQAFGFGLAQP